MKQSRGMLIDMYACSGTIFSWVDAQHCPHLYQGAILPMCQVGTPKTRYLT